MAQFQVVLERKALRNKVPENHDPGAEAARGWCMGKMLYELYTHHSHRPFAIV